MGMASKSRVLDNYTLIMYDLKNVKELFLNMRSLARTVGNNENFDHLSSKFGLIFAMLFQIIPRGERIPRA